MKTLSLEAKTPEHSRIKAYLEANASETLAEKINGGVAIEKDGKRLMNKKTLETFWKYACDEARKLAEKGASGIGIDDQTVFGWSVHYFEEDGIEGVLYNEDGTEYKPKPAATPYVPKAATPTVAPAPASKPQMAFDLAGLSDMRVIKDEELPFDKPNENSEYMDEAGEIHEAETAPKKPKEQNDAEACPILALFEGAVIVR
jgi:hypothetical protein